MRTGRGCIRRRADDFRRGAYFTGVGGRGSSGGKVKPITITENGTYNVSDAEKAEGYVGFGPVRLMSKQRL